MTLIIYDTGFIATKPMISVMCLFIAFVQFFLQTTPRQDSNLEPATSQQNDFSQIL